VSLSGRSYRIPLGPVRPRFTYVHRKTVQRITSRVEDSPATGERPSVPPPVRDKANEQPRDSDGEKELAERSPRQRSGVKEP
jgi:hypothetical protein